MYSSGSGLASTGAAITIGGVSFGLNSMVAIGALLAVAGIAVLFLARKTRRRSS